MTEPDMAHLMCDDELDALQIVVLQIGDLEKIGQKDHILSSKNKGRKCIQDTVFLCQIDFRSLLQA